MKLEPEDYPLIVTGNRIYARRQSSPIATCWDEELTEEIAARLNFTADMVLIPHIDLGNPAQVERFLRERDAERD